MIYRLLLIQVMMMNYRQMMKNQLHLKKSIVKQSISRTNSFIEKDLHPSFIFIDSESNQSSSQSRHPTIASLAKNYRIQYVKTVKEINGITTNQPEKRSLESPIMTAIKRQRPSSSTTASNSDNILQTLRNRIRNEENEQLYFNDERKR
jgi:hypothetical protein